MATIVDDAPNPDAERHNRDALHCVWDLHGGVWTCDEPECPEYRPEVHLEIDRRTGRRESFVRDEWT